MWTSPPNSFDGIMTFHFHSLYMDDTVLLRLFFFSFRLTNTVDTDQMVEDDRAIIPRIPAGVSGTALATSLLRDGWTVSCHFVL